MNLAFANHEIISDHLTASLAWLEAQGSVAIEVFERELYVSGPARPPSMSLLALRVLVALLVLE